MTVTLPWRSPVVITMAPCVTVTVPPQLSVASTAASLAAGTWAAHWTVPSGAHWEITGAVVSLTVIESGRAAGREKASDAVVAGGIVNLPGQLPGVRPSA